MMGQLYQLQDDIIVRQTVHSEMVEPSSSFIVWAALGKEKMELS